MRKTMKVLLGGFVTALALTACNLPAQSETLLQRLLAKRAEKNSRAAGASEAANGTTISIVSGGITRTFIVHVPPHPDAHPGAVLVFHGGSVGSAAHLENSIKLDALADRDGFLTVYPETANKNWTDGRDSTRGGPDDVEFTRTVVAYLESHYGVSSRKVFAAGLSNGGIFAYYLACKAPGLIRAIAPVSANMAQAQVPICASPRPMPVMMFSGVDDPLMPYDGGQPKLAKLLERLKGPGIDLMVSSPDTAAFWAKVNGCASHNSQNLPVVVSDGTSVVRTAYSNCRSGDLVTLFTINGAGHGWPGTGDTGRRLTGKNSNNISASNEMTAFFTRYGL